MSLPYEEPLFAFDPLPGLRAADRTSVRCLG